MSVEELREKGYVMTEAGWMNVSRRSGRIGFCCTLTICQSDAFSLRPSLEFQEWPQQPSVIFTACGSWYVSSICLQLAHVLPYNQRRDAGWIHTLLEEAENERMHLMSFLAIRKPGIFMRALILGAQGVFYNLFCKSPIMDTTRA